MIPGGYILQPRCVENSWIAHSAPVVRETWFYLLRKANHKDKKYSSFVVKRGQLFISFREIREALSWKIGYRTKQYSENQMKHTMKLLRIQLMIQLTNQPRGNLITICNYDEYQDPKNYESTSKSTNESTDGQPSINQSSPPINKNDKKEKNDNISNEIYNFTDSFIEYIYNKNTKIKKPSRQNSAETIEKLIRINKHPLDYIKKVLWWALKDDFWCKQVRSLIPLRKKAENGFLKFENIISAYEETKPLNGSAEYTQPTQEQMDKQNKDFLL